MADLDFTEQQAARFLRISARTLQRYRKAGRIGYHMLPSGRIRYSQDQLANFATRCRVWPVA